MVTYKIEWNYFNSKEKYRTTTQDFNDENHFNNFYNYCGKNESYRKIIGFERVYDEKKEFSTNELKAAYEAGRTSKTTFEVYFKQNFKREAR